MHDPILDDLNEQQAQAVTHEEGPLMVLAGAGSGKTRVVTRRIARLLRSGVRSGQILAMTFTNKAAGEMARRVEELGGDYVGSPRSTAPARAFCAPRGTCSATRRTIRSTTRRTATRSSRN